MDQRRRRALLMEGLNRLSMGVGRRCIDSQAGETWSVSTDIFETDREFIVQMELTGVDPGAIEVEVEETRLTVCGERKGAFPPLVRRVHQLEIERGHFEKVVTLPWPIDVAAAVTEYHQGLLVIIMPKRQRRVNIPVSSW